MDTAKIDLTDPQNFQMATVQAVTELKGDIKNLTDVVKELKKELQDRDKTYVTVVDHTRDIQDIYKIIGQSKKAGRVNTLLWSILSVIITLLITYFIETTIK